MDTVKKTISESIALLFGSGLSILFYFMYQSTLAKELGPDKYGEFFSAFSLVNFFFILSLMGVNNSLLKLNATSFNILNLKVISIIKFLFLNFIIVFSVLYLWAFFGPNDEHASNGIILLSLTLPSVIFMEILYSLNQIKGNFYQLSFHLFLINGFRFLIVFMFIKIFHSIDFYDALNIFVAISLLITVYISFRFYFLLNKPKNNLKKIASNNNFFNEYLDILNLSKYFGIANLCAFIWSTSNVILINYFLGSSEAGIFAIVILAINGISMLPNVIYTKYLYGKYHYWSFHNKLKLREIYNKSNVTMILLGFLITSFLFIFTDKIILNVFGNDYKSSILLILIYALFIPIKYYGHGPGAILMLHDNIKIKVKIMILVAIINTLINIIFIPIYGLLGALFSIIISESLLILLYFVKSKVFFNQLIS